MTHAETTRSLVDFVIDNELTDIVLVGHGHGHGGTVVSKVSEAISEHIQDLATACWTYDQLSPQPFGPMSEPLDLKKFHALDTPKSYLVCTDDIAMPPGEWGWHPRLSSRLGTHRLVQMPGNHETIFTDPIGLADKIIEAASD
ncbi:hypothetical protein [Mycobacterium montefiorense]|uniref:hypothetical protein n=1 Tax=Mycobacterium montefiorense TaxID=154654 RepID=UPI0021F380AF|nr:hypothetical protein [Mycobacterium montefiorense]